MDTQTAEDISTIERSGTRTPRELAGIVKEFASSVEWLPRVRLRADGRWYERLYHSSDYDVWLISWMPGQATGFHDHGGSAGAFSVAVGSLEEHRPGKQSRSISAGEFCWFGPDYAHDVRNGSHAPCVSIHAYSPPLTEMNQYDLEGDRLVPRTSEGDGRESGENAGLKKQDSEAPARVAGIQEMLAAARARLQRLTPKEAFAEVTNGKAVLVDIRPESQRAREGSIDGALVVERNVLEWRFDPTCSSRLPIASSHDLRVIVFCSEGYTSSLAAAALQELGLWRATDITGGIKAWQADGLPVSSSVTRPDPA